MKKESFWSLRIIVIVGFILLLSLLYFYPYVVDTIMCHYLQQHKFNNEPSDRGTFGDMYGALNSFLSGLAVLGIVLTLFWEKKVQEDKEERLDRDKLIYFSSVLNGTINTTKSFKSRLLENCDSILQDASQVPALVRDTNRHIIKTITIQEKYEEYFLAYRHIFHKDDILEAFSICIYLDEAISEYSKNYDEYYYKYIENHEKYLIHFNNTLKRVEEIVKSNRDANQWTELKAIRLHFGNSMINNSLLYIQKNILSTLINFTNIYFGENQFSDIKIELRQLDVVDTSYEGMVVVFKKFAHLLDIPIENLVKFNEGLEKL